MRLRSFAMRSMVHAITLSLSVASVALAETTTQPAPPPSAAVEMRAKQAFTRGEYANALPLLKQVAATLKDQPDRLGPVEEEIRVCQKNLEKLNPQAAAIAQAAA